MFRYRCHWADGDDLGEATYAVMIHAGDKIHLSGGTRFRALEVVSFDEEDDSPFVGMLRIEPA